MAPKTFCRRFLVIPLLFIPALSAYSLFVLWTIGLSNDKGLTLLLFAVPLYFSAFVLLVILIIWFFKRHVLWPIVQLYLVIGGFTFAFVHYDWDRMALHLNIYLYQEKREAVIERLHSDNMSVAEQNAMISADTLRNVPVFIQLEENEAHLQNNMLRDTGDRYVSDILVMRNCDGELTAEFMYESNSWGGSHLFLYSDALPEKQVEYSWTVGLGQVPIREYYTVEGYTVIETIKPHWYYVEQHNSSGFHLDFSGLFGGGGGGGVSSGGCQ